MYSKLKKSVRRFKHWMAFQPPYALSAEGWKSFNAEFREKAPIRWWFHRDFKKKFVYPIRWKYEAIRDWIRYRTYDRYHVLKTGKEPGYAELSERLLYVNFNQLKDFVEEEIAWSYYCWNNDERSKIKNEWKYKYIPLARHWFREPSLGVKHLEWAATLDDPALPVHERSEHQAVAARETLVLYKWWVEGRPGRKEIPLFLRNTIRDSDDIFDVDRDSDDYKEFVKNMDERDKQAGEWDDEDDEMLLRLIKIRRSLWT